MKWGKKTKKKEIHALYKKGEGGGSGGSDRVGAKRCRCKLFLKGIH